MIYGKTVWVQMGGLTEEIVTHKANIFTYYREEMVFLTKWLTKCLSKHLHKH